MLYIKIAECHEIVKLLPNAISRSQNKALQSADVYVQWALPYQMKHVGNRKVKEKVEMANSRLQQWGEGRGKGFGEFLSRISWKSSYTRKIFGFH